MQVEEDFGIGQVSLGAEAALNMIDTYDRPGNAYTAGTYAGAGTYAHGSEDEPGKRIPRARAEAGAGVGLVRAEYSVFEAEARGPNARAEAEASALAVKAFARAQVASASATAGPVKATVGLAADTGVSVGVDGVGFRLLGTGITLGPKPSIAVFGSELECVIS